MTYLPNQTPSSFKTGSKTQSSHQLMMGLQNKGYLPKLQTPRAKTHRRSSLSPLPTRTLSTAHATTATTAAFPSSSANPRSLDPSRRPTPLAHTHPHPLPHEGLQPLVSHLLTASAHTTPIESHRLLPSLPAASVTRESLGCPGVRV
ncbi:hypothetical protein CC86DRAFT_66586 [Ophiobolus disseminans]|uniref:Uncharacterized protein n=1 Tax=Ophiobolus disseminans TaxID=1469910 RepID=A0A6A6ZQI8_9PLEO|nr:hypothetical protein CC86DRAFT_66586 [Ophiobolus disseminans]